MGIPNLIGHYRDGRYRRDVKVMSTVSTGYNPSFEESGRLFLFSSAPTTCAVRLPRASSKHLGITYEFALVAGTTSVDIITNLDSSARIVGVPGTSDTTGAAVQSIRPDSSKFWTMGRITNLTSVIWFFEPQAHPIMESTAGEIKTTGGIGSWSTGSTST